LSTRSIRIRKRDLAIMLQKVSPHPKPKVALEQYTIPADLAADILFSACYVYGDIDGKRVVDLGTGTGRLAIGAALLNAEYVVAVDVDPISLTVAAENSKRFGVHVDWVLTSAETIRGQVNTVIMNPPFGTRQPHADIRFLNLALEIGEVVYSIHKSSTRRFLSQWTQKRGYEASEILSSKMEIPHQFTFHRKERGSVDVCVIRIRSRSKR